MLSALSDSSSVEIEGTRSDLMELSRDIKGCESFCRIPLFVPARLDDRGLRYLKELVITVEQTLLRIWEADEQLFICGARENLDLFSANVEWLTQKHSEEVRQTRTHLHVEFYPGHFFLSEDALPLVLTVGK
jgi:hypothetical protein